MKPLNIIVGTDIFVANSILIDEKLGKSFGKFREQKPKEKQPTYL